MSEHLPAVIEKPSQTAIIPISDIERMAKAIANSGLFGMKNPEQALALMLVAQAEGLHPATIARDYHIIQNRPALKADSMLARFQQAGGKVEWTCYTDERVAARFSHPQGGSLEVDWDMARAKAAGLGSKDNWRQYPRAMLRARVISEGIRTVYPGVLVGMYTPEEVSDFSEITLIRDDLDSVIASSDESPPPPPSGNQPLTNRIEPPADAPADLAPGISLGRAKYIIKTVATKVSTKGTVYAVLTLQAQKEARALSMWHDLHAFLPLLGIRHDEIQSGLVTHPGVPVFVTIKQDGEWLNIVSIEAVEYQPQTAAVSLPSKDCPPPEYPRLHPSVYATLLYETRRAGGHTDWESTAARVDAAIMDVFAKLKISSTDPLYLPGDVAQSWIEKSRLRPTRTGTDPTVTLDTATDWTLARFAGEPMDMTDNPLATPGD